MNDIYFLLLWNAMVFLIYGYDKFQAKRKGWRIAEYKLLLLAFLMGGAGALAAMFLFRHKTQKPMFQFGVPMLFLLNIALLYFIWAKGFLS